MADETVQKLKIELEASANTSSAKKAGQELAEAAKGGMEKVAQKASESFEKSLTDPIRELKRMLAELARGAKMTGWEKMKETLSGVGNVAKFIGSNAMSGIGRTASGAFKNISESVKASIKHLNGFFSAIKRIAIYRAIRWALKQITQGFQEGIQNAYQWSVVTGNKFAQSMDMMATSALYLKNSLGAMTMPLVNTLAPILDALVDKFVALINVVNQFTAALTGAGTWTRALKYPKQYADAVGGAAREIKNQLLGFDELNILKAPSTGGGAAALDYSSMFENVALSAKNLDFANKIKEAIKQSKWGDVGKIIGQKFNDTIKSLDALTISKAIGEKVNNAISLVHSLLNEADFHQVGVKIGEFMSNFKLDWARIAGSWVRWKTNMLDALLGLVNGVNWANVGRAIGNFISGLFNEFANWLKQVNWYQKGIEFTNALVTLISNVNWSAVARAIWEGLKGALSAAMGLLNGALSQVEFDRYGQASLTSSNPYSGSTGAASAAVAGAMAGIIRPYASGGFPEVGSLFYAGEQGAEFVSNVGGRTGVYNTDQMANALANANENVVEAVAAMANAIVGAINRKDTSINVNDVRIALRNSNLRYGV